MSEERRSEADGGDADGRGSPHTGEGDGMSRNRAIVQTRFVGTGWKESLELVHRDVPTATAGTVVIRLTTRSINPNDLTNVRDNKLQSLQDDHHPVIGSEGCGRISQVGEGVTRFKVDERVVPVLYWKYYLGKGEGAWQDYIVVSEEDVVAVPSILSDEIAAQYIINPWTAYGLLKDVGVPEGEYLLQTAASSTIGRQVIQICKYWGIKTINVVRRDDHVDELKALGSDEIINSSTEDVVERVRRITNGVGAYAAIDSVGGILTKNVAGSVQDGGKVFVYGTLGGWDITVSKLDLMRNVGIKYFRLTRWLEKGENRNKVMRDVMRYLEAGILLPNAGKKYPLEDFGAAILESERDGRGGKVLLQGEGSMAAEEEAAEMMDTLNDLNLSKDEVTRLTKAMKDPKFKEMFQDYAKEISDPKNKQVMEEQIKRCENRGKSGQKEFSMEGKELLIPYSDFCIKTRNMKTTQKVFINLCYCEKVGNPVPTSDGFRRGTQWEIPYSLGTPSKEKDKAGKECEVHDFIVGTEAHENATKDKRFKQFLIVTALEAIEKQRNVELDRKFSLPQLKYKGKNGSKETRMFTVPKEKVDVMKTGRELARSRSPFKFDRENKQLKFEDKKEVADGDSLMASPNEYKFEEDVGIVHPEGWQNEVEPKHEIVYRSNVNMGEYWEDNKLGPESPLPAAILVRVTLPSVIIASDILVDLEESRVLLRVPGKYRLQVQLQYAVDGSRGSAKWEKKNHQLTVALPVIGKPKLGQEPSSLI